MMETFLNSLKDAQTWFFGNLLNDPFFSGCVDILNAIICVSLFYGLVVYPVGWAIRMMGSFIKRRFTE